MIKILCGPDELGAYADLAWTKDVQRYNKDHVIYCREFAHGCVINTWERNGYDDSDFYANYYDAEAGSFKQVCYASTRGWTYPCSADVDATPEVIEKWKAVQRAESERVRKLQAEQEDRTPRKGKLCKIIATRGKAAAFNGKQGVIFWTQERRSQYGTWSYGIRVGVKVDGQSVFCNATAIELLGAQQ